jgi:hypothetical protein
VAGQRLHRQRHPTGAGDDLGDRHGVQAGGDRAGQRAGGGGLQRRDHQPAGRGGPQRGHGRRGQPVRGAQRGQHAAVRGQQRQGRQGDRIDELQVVDDEQAAAYARAHRLGQQRHVGGGQPHPYRPGQRECRHAAQHGQPAAGEHRPAERGGQPAQQAATPGSRPARDHDQSGPAQQLGGVGGQGDLAAGVGLREVVVGVPRA